MSLEYTYNLILPHPILLWVLQGWGRGRGRGLKNIRVYLHPAPPPIPTLLYPLIWSIFSRGGAVGGEKEANGGDINGGGG